MKNKIKVKPSGTNIFVIDTKAEENRPSREKAGFFTMEEAEEYIENHERPNDLICIFDKHYEQRYLDNFKKTMQEKKLHEEDFEVLKLISLGNYQKGIEAYLKRNIDDSLKRLELNDLIETSYSDIKITKNGETFINK